MFAAAGKARMRQQHDGCSGVGTAVCTQQHVKLAVQQFGQIGR